jgi:hypothetical protein
VYHDGGGEGDLGWYSCDACSVHISSGTCPTGCTWLPESSVEGICVPSQTQSNNIKCSILSKPLCDRYSLASTYIPGVDVTDAPCLFNGADESDTLCVSQSSLASQTCTAIKSNGVVAYGEDERKLCDEAHLIIAEWPFICSWVESSYEGDYGSCFNIYFLKESGLLLVFIFIFHDIMC